MNNIQQILAEFAFDVHLKGKITEKLLEETEDKIYEHYKEVIKIEQEKLSKKE